MLEEKLGFLQQLLLNRVNHECCRRELKNDTNRRFIDEGGGIENRNKPWCAQRERICKAEQGRKRGFFLLQGKRRMVALVSYAHSLDGGVQANRGC